MGFCKLQIGCMVIIVYVLCIYVRECMRLRQKHKFCIFDGMLGLGMLAIFLDGMTAYTVNHLETVNELLNKVLHMCFLLCLDSFIFLLFIYMMSITNALPKKKSKLMIIYGPFLVNVLLVVINMPTLEYYKGELSNYSMGLSAYTCFVMAGVYIALSILIVIMRWRYIESHKRISVFTYLFVLACITMIQMCYPQSLISCICVTVIIIGVYINQENPSVEELSCYHHEMIMGFATLVENKDGSTGGHIKRTTMYVKVLAEELRRRGYYKEVLTQDYMNHLYMAAPMHDIGKIAVPDVVLQKPGKLTDEEFAMIKQHAQDGGRIIQETFGHLHDRYYAQMAYDVARYHHEKWNGKGYPEGLKENEIPLCARIMAIADVFDAVSEKRCYRDAMPLEECFDIIRNGRGTDFEPLLVDVFLDMKDIIEKIHHDAKQ